MKRDKDEQALKEKYDTVDDENFLTDKQKRREKKLWKKRMTKLTRKKNNKVINIELEDLGEDEQVESRD